MDTQQLRNECTPTRRFRQRVDTERRALSIVNAECVSATPLTGLTAHAIDAWRKSLESTDLEPETIAGLTTLLSHVAARCQLEADNSRDVFENGALIDATTIEDALQRLQEMLRSWRSLPNFSAER